jgi:hypothetical protein
MVKQERIQERTKVKKRRYIAALALTLLVFALGLLFGLVLDSQRATYIKSEANKQSIEYNSLQLQYQILNDITQNRECTPLLKTFESSVKNLESARIRLEQYQQSSTFNKDDFALLGREYSLAQIRYFMLAKKTQELCGNDVVTVLYFFADPKECPDCDSQSFILTYTKKLMGDKVLIFSFNANITDQEPSVLMLKDIYNVSSFPTVIINEKKFVGAVSTDNVISEICKNFNGNYTFCGK